MANPPITVGELVDVPAPQSPVDAQFHQEVAHRIVHRFASVAAMNAWAAGNGSVAFVQSPAQHYVRRGGAWVPLPYAGQPDSVVAGMIAAGAVSQTADLADSIVTSAKIVDRTIVATDLAVAVLEAGWATVDMSGGNYTGASSAVKKIGNIVWYRMQATVASAGAIAVGTVPDGYRPSGTNYVPVVNVSNGAAAGLAVAASGAITITGAQPIGHVLVASGHWAVTP